MRQPRSLADLVLSALPSFSEAPMARDIAAHLSADEPSIRAAFDQLEKDQRAKIVRRGRGLYLVPADYPGRICPVCRVEYVLPKKSRRVTCSRSCGIKLSWRDPDVYARRNAACTAARRTPEARAKQTEINNKRWAKPDARAKLSEINKKRWADPYENAKMSAGISKHHRQPEEREKTRQRIKARWDDDAGRAKLVTGIRKSKQAPEARAKFSELLRERWKDPVWREKWEVNTIRAREMAKRNKGKKQSPEHIAKRVASLKARKAAGA